jgi:hypothetical protein
MGYVCENRVTINVYGKSGSFTKPFCPETQFDNNCAMGGKAICELDGMPIVESFGRSSGVLKDGFFCHCCISAPIYPVVTCYWMICAHIDWQIIGVDWSRVPPIPYQEPHTFTAGAGKVLVYVDLNLAPATHNLECIIRSRGGF